MSEEKQIEEMALELCRPRNIVKMIHNRTCGNCDTSACDIYELCVDLYNAGYRKQSEWISVEERLPDKDGWYITFTNATGESKGVIAQHWVTSTVRGQKVRRWMYLGRLSPWRVTHWMPLPQPPKGGE